MLRYVAKRVLIMIPTVLVISALVFFIINLPPGDCVTAQIDELLSQGDPDAAAKAEQLRRDYGLDKPVWLQYVSWVWGIFGGDFGLSCQDRLPVSQLIGERIALAMVMEISTIIFWYSDRLLVSRWSRPLREVRMLESGLRRSCTMAWTRSSRILSSASVSRIFFSRAASFSRSASSVV